MLERLLRLVRKGGSFRVKDLARRLDVTPELVEMMLEDLTRMGYLRPVDGQCGDRCSVCPLKGTCAVAGDERVWALRSTAERRTSNIERQTEE